MTTSNRLKSLIRTITVPIALLAAVCGAAHPAMALEIDLPAETALYKQSDMPGYTLTLQNCLMCHSAQYAQYQPKTSPRSYWEATVKKMKHPFGAPFPETDIPAMVDYLTKTYGAESSTAATTK
ncbi:cytochrome c [Diaphorobacter sp. HDW4A]|uniref:SorB family sulfite dehydrogenase c-type cytochrome subunit n=1 Tax=Diaphorobacter sp. HDW4A TaxID=2714924 RepID=UPI0014084D7C|nr:cytochrome c [Diaphorobacter sp. HDW4A]